MTHVSVILPVFNRQASVARAIESVLAQTAGHLELIVIDDGSTDGTPDVLGRYREKTRILRQDNRGAYAARNRGIAAARGEILAFIDSDDRWHSDKLERQLPLLRRPEVALVYGDAVRLSTASDGAPSAGANAFRLVPPRRGRVTHHFATGNFVPTSTVLVRRAALEAIGGFREARLSADYLAWFRIACAHELDFVDQAVADYTVHADGISYALGRSLAARIALFSEELDGTDDVEIRTMLKRLLFNLGIHLMLAKLRGRAEGVADPFALARAAMAHLPGPRAAAALARFGAMQAGRRTRRLMG